MTYNFRKSVEKCSNEVLTTGGKFLQALEKIY